MSTKIILFDGVCNFCNFWVKFVLKNDYHQVFRFASLQSEVGMSILQQYNLSTTALNSVILIDDGKSYTQSSAALGICKYLSSGWKALYVFIFVPKVIRDAVYNFIARHRYQWFGKSATCMIPDPSVKARFL